jgi:O-antigen/teichoic acid export membrane protein
MTIQCQALEEKKPAITLNAFLLILSKLIPPVLNLTLLVVMAKAFNRNVVGGYYLPITWLIIFQGFVAMGVGDVVARETGRSPDRAGRYFTNGLLLGFASSLLASVAMIWFSRMFHYPRDIELSIMLLSVSLPPSAVLMVGEGLYLAKGETKYLVFVSIFETLFSVGLNLILLLRGYSLLALMGVIVATRFFSAIIHLMIIHRKVARLSIEVDCQLLRSMLSPTIVFGLGKILALIVLKADVIILSKLRTIGEVGLYTAATRLMEAWLHLPHAFGFVMFPLLAREFYRSKQSTHDILIRTTRRLFSIVTPVIVGIILFSEEIILLLYGETFLDAIPLVRLLMLSFLLICGDVLLGNTCRALERQNFDLAVLAVTATVNVALNLLLIPHYGLVGACCATIISMGVSLVTHWYYVRSRVFELDWMGAFLKPLALVIPSTLAVVIFRRKIDPLLLTGIFLGSYSLGLWLTKGSLRRP